MRGIIAAVPTAINAEGVPQKAPFIEHCKWALANGCDGLNILGSTGEANSISLKNRMQIMEWAASEISHDRLMVGTATPSIDETIALTQHADDSGYQVALVLPPYYYKPLSDEGLIAWFSALHSALDDRQIAIYFYNFPQMTGVTISPTVIQHLHENWPKRFAGIKDSSGDLDYCRALTKAMPKLAVFPSSETSLGEAAQSGFAGCISATANVTSQWCAKVWATKENPDPEALQKLSEVRAAVTANPLIPAIKYLVSRRTADAGWMHVVPPFMKLTAAQMAKLDLIG